MSVMSFKISALFCGVEKGRIENRETLSISQKGVKEDYHNDSEIIMLDLNSYNSMIEQRDKALCMSKFYAHIILDNPNKYDLSIGDVPTNRDVRLRIIKIGKDCHVQNNCEYAIQNIACPLNTSTYYLECINAGKISINDPWEVEKCIVTL